MIKKTIARYDLEAENTLLGAIILKPKIMAYASLLVKKPDYFYSPQNRLLWILFQKMIDQKLEMNDFTIKVEMEKSGYGDKIDFNHVSQLTLKLIITDNWENYANQIVECFRARELAKSCYEILNSIEEKKETKPLWIDIINKFPKIYRDEKEYIYTVHDLIDEIEKAEKGIKPIGILLNYEPLDSRLGRIVPGTINIIAGRPGSCKTALALQLADSLAINKHKVLYDSLEMNAKNLYMRRLARRTGITYSDIKYGNVKKRWDIIHAISAEMYENDKCLKFKDKKYNTSDEIVSDIKIAHDLHGIEVFILDHWHRVILPISHDSYIHRAEKAFEKIISTCANNNITSIILAQLSRESARRTTHNDAPILSDIRDLGRIEEVADTVIFTHWQYKATNKKEDRKKINLRIAKSRDGDIDDSLVNYQPEIFKFGGEIYD